MVKGKPSERVNSIALVGNYLPRRCGIATFTTDLCEALTPEMPDAGRVEAVVMDDVPQGYPYPQPVKFQVRANVQSDYRRAAEFINISQFDLVVLQHEFGIYGGRAGAYILRMLKLLRMPVMATLHTVLVEPDHDQRAVMHELAKYCERLIVMSRKAQGILKDVYGIDESKSAYIPHGIPDLPFSDPRYYKDQFGLAGRKVILTFGLLSPGKGIEFLIDAMPAIVREHPDAVYVVLGVTHPHVKKATGDAYRSSLVQRVSKLGMDEHVVFRNEFVTHDTLYQYLGAADVYVTPYLSEAQITSGTLAFAMGSGTAVVSTPYWHAQEMLADGRGLLIPFRDSAAAAAQITGLLSDDAYRLDIRRKAYEHTRSMVWDQVAQQYIRLAQDELERLEHSPNQSKPIEPHAPLIDELPEIDLTHLYTLSDDTGIIQHAIHATPDLNHGYCIDDNARSLIAVGMYYGLRQDETIVPLMQRYLAFINYALNHENGRFRNFMTYDRRWLEDAGSEDSHGRTLWGLGAAVMYAPNHSIRGLATRLIVAGLPAVEQFEHPRAWAFTLLGLHKYLSVYGGDTDARRMRQLLAEKLYTTLMDNATDDWVWWEDELTYANAKLPHALLLSGQWIPDIKMYDAGLRSLNWVLDKQMTPEGHLSIIGNEKWMTRDGTRSHFDQQPIEAMGLVEACVEAYRSTRDREWLTKAYRCFEWFLGRNDLSIPLYDFKTGGCCDGLRQHGTNLNQGAESSLAWLISLLTMYEVLSQEALVIETKQHEADPVGITDPDPVSVGGTAG